MIWLATGNSSFSCVLVDRVDMVHVVLHLRDDAAEIGDEAAEHASLVHPPQRGFRILFRSQDFEEQAVGLGVLAQLAVDEAQGLRHRPQRARVDVKIVLLRDMEQAQQTDRILLEEILGRDRQPLTVADEPLERAPPAAPAQP